MILKQIVKQGAALIHCALLDTHPRFMVW